MWQPIILAMFSEEHTWMALEQSDGHDELSPHLIMSAAPLPLLQEKKREQVLYYSS